MSTVEYFEGVDKIAYEGPDSRNPMAFKYYNADEVIAGKPMKDHLRFSVCYWHTFRGAGLDIFGAPTQKHKWDDGSGSVQEAKNRADAAFEFFTKLGVEHFTFHDVDVAPPAATLAETNDKLDEVVEYIEGKMKATGVKLLWGTANLFSDPRYMNGAGTNPDFAAFARAAAQVKKAMEVTHRLGGQNYVFWGGREGYQSVLNTDMRRELDHAAAFFRMARDHKASIGAKYQLLVEPKPREPTRHQYDYDAATVMGFLGYYGLTDDFKLNIEPNHTTLAGHDYEHDIAFASQYGMLGSVDANTGDPVCGWDTDQFPMNVQQTTKTMGYILDQGGLSPGGLNFDCKLRRESTDPEDLFLGHIGAMDSFARGLRAAVKIREDGILPGMVAARYSSWDTGMAAKVEAQADPAQPAEISFDDLHEFVTKNGEPKQISGKQELFEVLFNDYT